METNTIKVMTEQEQKQVNDYAVNASQMDTMIISNSLNESVSAYNQGVYNGIKMGAQFLDSLRKPSEPHEIIVGNRQYVRRDLALEFSMRFYQIMVSARVDEYVGARKDVCVNDLFEEFIKSKSDERP